MLALHRGTLPERVVLNTPDGFRVIANRYDTALNLGRLARNIPFEGPLFGLDAGINAYFQYQAESDLPGGIWGLRGWRAIAGGAGNAGISAGVTFVGALALNALGCAETFGAWCVVAAVGTLSLDFGANLAFDEWGKEWYLETFFGLGREEFDKSQK